MEEKIVNRVVNSSLVTIDLDDYYMVGDRVVIDLKDNLENGFLLRESNFREFIKQNDWGQFKDKFVAVYCSVEAIIPNWAYMLVASRLSGVARKIVFGDLKSLESKLFSENISKIKGKDFLDKKVVIKGCGKIDAPESVYLEITSLLTPFVSNLMFGEPCSTVPVFKRQKT